MIYVYVFYLFMHVCAHSDNRETEQNHSWESNGRDSQPSS